MSKLDSYFIDYAAYHQTRGNARTHLVGIPLIMIAVLSWCARWVWIHAPSTAPPESLLQLDFGCLIILFATIWYTWLDWRIGFSFLPILYGLYWIGRALPNEGAWIFFIGGWALQLMGHWVYEKKSPAFTKNLEHLLVGPAWIFVKILHLRGESTIPSRSQHGV